MKLRLFVRGVLFGVVALSGCSESPGTTKARSEPSVGQGAADLDDPHLRELLPRVFEAYQTERLLGAATLRVEEDMRTFYDSHDYGPDFHDLTPQRRHFILDYSGARGSAEYLTHIGAANYHARGVLVERQMRFIDYGNATYETSEGVDFGAYFGGVIRASDVLLAHLIASDAEGVSFVRDQSWLGRLHAVLSVPQVGSPTLEVFVDRATGAISRMTRTIPGGPTMNYVFAEHEVDDSVLIAREHSLFANDELLYFSFARRVVVDDPVDATAFAVEESISSIPTLVDQSEMTVDSLGAGLHHVGQGEAYSTFVDTEDGLVAFGTHAGFSERLDAYRAATGDRRPLSWAAVPDHHRSEIAGVVEAVGAGATLLATRHAVDRLTTVLAEAGLPTRVEAVEGERLLGGLRIVSVPSTHASQNLVAYNEPSGVFLQSGHYVSPYQFEPFYAKHMAVTLRDEIHERGFAPDAMLSLGGRKRIDWTAFEAAVNAHDPTRCHRERAICGG